MTACISGQDCWRADMETSQHRLTIASLLPVGVPEGVCGTAGGGTFIESEIIVSGPFTAGSKSTNSWCIVTPGRAGESLCRY